MSISPQRIELPCPGCGRLIAGDVWRVVDVGQKPGLKEAVLRGQLNVVGCPHCGRRTVVATPLAYHDPQKELFFCVLPGELSLSGDEQNKVIGELTNLLLDSLSAEKRKAYLFQPQTLFSTQRLREEMLRAEGVTEEVQQSLAERGELIQKLLAQIEDEAALKTLVEEHKARLDYEFFLQLTASLEDARQEGHQALAEQLTSLRAKLLELAGAPHKPAWEKISGDMTQEELIEQLRAHSTDEGFKTLVAVVRPLLDYQFFQGLTAQIEAAQGKGETTDAEELTATRSKLLDIIEELDKEAKEVLDRAVALLREIVESDDMEAAAAEKLDQIDGAFLTVLDANIAAAGEAGQQQLADKLHELEEHVLSLLEARLPPELVLINRLLAAGGAEERQTLLDQRADTVNEQFLELLRQVAEELRGQGHEAAERLAESAQQVEAMLKGRAT